MPKDEFNNSAHIIYSADKDLTQCLHSDNIFQYYRHYRLTKMLSQKDIFKHVFKLTIDEIESPAEWFCMALAIVGDAADGFKGINGIGPKRCISVLPQIMTLCGGSIDKVYQNIRDKKPLFDRSYVPNNNIVKKIIDGEDIIVRNMKLLSFELLSDFIDGGFPTYVNDRKQLMIDNMNNIKKVPNAMILYEALEKRGLTNILQEDTIRDLF
jgi:5'-3' exonuclease